MPLRSFHPRRHLIAAAILALAAPAAWAQPAAPAAATAARSFDIAAQPLDAALSDLARQAGMQMLAAPALLQGRTAP
ncbi:hypothetical protein, partial [Comamonas antarctica]